MRWSGMLPAVVSTVGLLSVSAPGAAQSPPARPAARDTAFAAMQQRGKQAMGVDQYTSTHHFEATSDGGVIRLERDVDDTAGVARIRAHMREIARAFAAGDFSTPEFVHMQPVPGTQVMVERRALIHYEPHDLPRGAEVRIATRDSAAVRAIHEFLAFQRAEHHAAHK